MNQSESIVNLLPSLVKAIGEIKSIHKDSTNPFFKSKYASLDAIIDGTKEILLKHSLCLVQGVDNDGVETFIFHSSGEWISSGRLLIPLENNQKNSPAQLIGINVTYAKRYQLSSILGISTGEDTDGNYPDQGTTPKGNPPKGSTPPPPQAPVQIKETPPQAPKPKPAELPGIPDERFQKACELISKGDFKVKDSLLKSFSLTQEQAIWLQEAEDIYYFNHPEELKM